uniref:ARAD1D32692p n=1 Tax=Blastobotrys adeninivorans TaxID=409370 RepID=A0A060TC26_BLAAD
MSTSGVTRNSSTEEPSPLPVAEESVKYIRALFQETDPDSPALDPQRYKVLTYGGDSDFAIIIKTIEDIIDQQQFSSVFAGDFVIIIYNGRDIEERVIDHLESVDVKYTCLSGPGDCLILTIATDPHAAATYFCSEAMSDILFTTNLMAPSEIYFHIRDAIQNRISNDAVYREPQLFEPQLHEGSKQFLEQQLQNLRQLLRSELQRLLPALPEQPLDAVNHMLNDLLNNMDAVVKGNSGISAQNSIRRPLEKSNLIRELRKQLSNKPQSNLWRLIQSQLGSGRFILPSGSSSIPIYIYNAQSICERLFKSKESERMAFLLSKKDRGGNYHGSKIPDYSVCPAYFNYVRCVLDRPFIPSITVEVGQSCNIGKVLVDCVFTIMGTRFQIDAAYGVDLHVDRAKKMLEYIDVYHFDASLETLVKIRDELGGRDKATVSMVIKHKAQLKYNDLRVLELLRDWEKSGNTDEESYRQLFRSFSELKVLGSLPYGMPLGGNRQAPKLAAMNLLDSYRRYTDHMLDQEKSEYDEILTECRNIVDQYMELEGTDINEKQFVREGETTLIQHIFERRKLTRVDENSTEPMLFPMKCFTGIRLTSEESISLSPMQLHDWFDQVVMSFRDYSVDDIEVSLPLRRDFIRGDCVQDVAIMNYPHVPSDEAAAELERAYRNSPDGFVELRVKVRYVFIERQLKNWNIQPERTEYGNQVLFIHEHSKRYPNRKDQSPPTGSHESQKRDHSSPSSSGQDQNEGPIAAQSVTYGAENLRTKMRKLGSTVKAKLTFSNTQD